MRVFVVLPALPAALFIAAPVPRAHGPADMEALQKRAAEVQAAIERKDGPAASALLAPMLAEAPDHPGLLLALARARSLDGNRGAAVRALARAAEIGFGLDAPEDPILRTLAGSPGAERIFARIRENGRPVAAGRQAFLLGERDLIPEGVAWDAATRRLFVGSLYKRKIVAVDPAGAARDFVTEGADGLWQVLGMKVDTQRRRLVVCSAADPQMRGFQESDRGRSGVFAFDLKSGAVVMRALLPSDGKKHLFNDLALTADGGAYVTDSEEGSVWRLDSSERLTRFVAPSTFYYPNGIALSPDERSLYVASFTGVDRVELATGVRTALPHPSGVTLVGVDGLYLHGHSLIAVQNGVRPHRIAVFALSKRYDRVVSGRVLDRLDPLVTDPTTGVVAGERAAGDRKCADPVFRRGGENLSGFETGTGSDRRDSVGRGGAPRCPDIGWNGKSARPRKTTMVPSIEDKREDPWRD